MAIPLLNTLTAAKTGMATDIKSPSPIPNPLKSTAPSASGASTSSPVTVTGDEVSGVQPVGNVSHMASGAASGTAAEQQSAPTPIYQGPSTASIPHVASLLGAQHTTDPNTGIVNVNGTSIRPTSIVNGVSHGPVTTVAAAAGHPATHIQTDDTGTVTLQPHAATNPETQPAQMGPSPADNLAAYMASRTTTAPQTQPSLPLPAQTSVPQYLQTQHGIPSTPPVAPVQHQPQPQPQIPTSLQVQHGVGTNGQPTTPATPTPNIPTGIQVQHGVGPTGTPQTPVGTQGTQTGQLPINQYWQNVQANKGLWQTNMSGLSAQQWIQQLAAKYGISPNQIQVNSAGHAFIPWAAIQNYAVQQSNPNGLPGTGPLQGITGGLQGTSQDQFQQLLTALVGALAGGQNPYAQQIATLQGQMPTMNIDQNALMQQAWQMENPTLQAQMQAQEQKINDDMNKRGIYTSGLAEQAIQGEDNALYGNAQTAAMKDYNSLYNQANTNYKDQLQGWMDQINALHDAGGLSNTQFAQILTGLNDAMSRVTSQQNSDTTASNDAATQAYHQQALAEKTANDQTIQQLNQYKAQIDAAYKNGQLTIDQYKADTQALNDQMTQALNQQKLIDQQLNQAGQAALPNGGTAPTVAQQNTNEKMTMDQFNQWLNTQKLNTTQKAQAFTQWLDTQKLNETQAAQTYKQWLDTQKLSDTEKQQAFTQWLDTQKLTTTQKQDQFTQWLDTQKLNQTAKQQAFTQWLDTQKLNQTAKQQQFTQWLGTQKLKQTSKLNAFKQWLDTQKLTETQKQDAVKNYQNQEKIDVSKENASTSASKAATAAQQGQEKINLEAQKQAQQAQLDQAKLNETIRHNKANENVALGKAQNTQWSDYVTKTTTQLNDTINQTRQILQNPTGYTQAQIASAQNTLNQSMQQLQDLTIAPASPQVAQYAQEHPGSSVAQLNQAWNEAQAAQNSKSSSSGKKPVAKPKTKSK